MYNILTLNAISNSIYEWLNKDNYAVDDKIKDYQGILVRSADCREMEFSPNLLAIARAGAGVNNIPIEACTQKGIVVFNTPGANANAVTELALCCMLMASRNVLEGINWVKGLKGDDIILQVEQGKHQFLGNELSDKTLLVVGLGAIGVNVANDAKAIGMNVIGYDPFISVEHAWGLSRSIRRTSSLEETLPHCDYISLHIPLMEKTRGLINKRVFSLLKPGAILLNLARGELVEYEALKEALQEGILRRYVTDFPSAQTLNLKGVIATPHLGATTPESEENCARMAARELHEYLSYGNIVNSVNMPRCQLAPSSSYRICVLHHNIKNMVGQISAVVANANCNIANMVNASRGDIAYTLMDIDEKLSDEALCDIREINGVIRCRSLLLSPDNNELVNGENHFGK